MKNMIKTMCALVMVAFAAHAADLVKQSTYIGTSTIPFAASGQGVALYDPGSQKSAKEVVVTIADVHDGGTDQNAIWVCSSNAYRFNPYLGDRDGGAGWYRDSTMDLTCPAPTTGVVLGYSMQKAFTAPGMPGERLYYISSATDDAGAAIVHKVNIQARY